MESTESLQTVLARGRERQQVGDFPKAEHAYRKFLAVEPTNAEVWYLLGQVGQAQGKIDEALASFQQSLAIKPDFAPAHNSLGIAHVGRRRLDEAAACFERASRASPTFAHAHNNLGNVRKEQGRLDEALACYQNAVRLKPDFAEAHNNLGNLYLEQGRLEEAAACCRQALALKPDLADAHNNVGAALAAQGKHEAAEASYREALRLRPSFAEAHNNLGNALRELGRIDEAVASLHEAVRLKTDFAEAHGGLGMALLSRGDLDAAAASCRRAIELKPRLAQAHVSLGFVLSELGQLEESLAEYDTALSIESGLADARKNRSLVWLLQGRLGEAWPEYEARWKAPELPPRPFREPLWDGSPLAGKTILLHAEQGLGDTLQFIRYAALVRERGGRVVVACQRPLVPLLTAGCAGIERVVAQGDPLPAFEVHAPLLSLPRIFGTTLDNVPANVPYIQPDPRLVETWRRELSVFRGTKVGIAWQGSLKYRWDRKRSVPLSRFEALARVNGVQLFSLQKGHGSEQLAQATSRFPLVDLARRLDETAGPFVDTAAVMKCLDLVITTDTAIPHLAGALGVPVWCAVSYMPDWRWLLGRDDSPWYPTMRLFRQQRLGEWDEVFERMAAALYQWRSPSGPRPITIEVAAGELLDKLTILRIKAARITDPARLRNVQDELEVLEAARGASLGDSRELAELTAELTAVNEALWDIEDEIRVCERQGDFGPRFVELARSVYHRNDHRAAVKRRINELLGSKLIEEKSYATY
ncbi:MAG TPA: tetratricopeptide repeat protein [Pirellulales bacterium]|jgi:tetratricopeptide (TPR) repeat protein|nr:tetratricopeptide repeat protein [Pirellulales bacterium]